jgi:4-hydroxythreonine-4-phosphate dehydrogenase
MKERNILAVFRNKMSITEKLPTGARIALSAGDTGGIGVEIILKALADSQISQSGAEFTIFGDRAHIYSTYDRLVALSAEPLADPRHLAIVDIDPCGAEPSFAFVDGAIRATLAGQFAGIVTAPIAKVNWHRAGHFYSGQTELLAERAGITDYGMLFVARSPHTGWQLRVLLATVHIPLQEVSHRLCPDLITQKLNLLIKSLGQDFGLGGGKIAIAGINPHSGEGGQLGTEETEWLVPTLRAWQAHQHHWQVTDPIPPDSLWIGAYRAWHQPEFVPHAPTAYLAMYHDQGLIPVKMLGFAEAVNTTIGLPFVRTSPDHGTAFDIAGQGIADSSSFQWAIRQALAMIAQRSR